MCVGLRVSASLWLCLLLLQLMGNDSWLCTLNYYGFRGQSLGCYGLGLILGFAGFRVPAFAGLGF